MSTAPGLEPPQKYPLVHGLAMLIVLAIFLLIGVGGNVTSLEAGMAVPDGFRTFGHWPWWAPLDVWFYEVGTYWEHKHRLIGHAVGVMAIALALAMIIRVRHRPWLRWSGLVLLLLIILQGVMGIVRVEQISTAWAMVHGVFGQIVFGLAILIATALGGVWARTLYAERTSPPPLPPSSEKQGADPWRGARWLSIALLSLLVVQLILGAGVRHADAALAIPDLPLSYGQVIPPLSQGGIDDAIAALPPHLQNRDYTESQVRVHFLHRVGAVVVTFVASLAIGTIGPRVSRYPMLLMPVLGLGLLLLLQLTLGISVVYTGDRMPEMATMHQTTGAALLGCTVWLAVRVQLAGRLARVAPLNESATKASPAPRPAGRLQGEPA